MIGNVLFGILFLYVPVASVESTCCKEVKNVLENKTLAYKTLCSADNMQISAKCCKDIAREVENSQHAYDTLCGSTGSCDDPQALGMESGKIPDAAITASSSYNSHFLPKYARLNTNNSAGCAWLKNNADSIKPWLQVDFGKEVVVTAVATQGRCNYKQWTETYVIWYSNDGANWTYYKESDTTKIFTGNTDQNTVVTNSFQPPITARYVRISPKSWYSYASTRIEYYGCR